MAAARPSSANGSATTFARARSPCPWSSPIGAAPTPTPPFGPRAPAVAPPALAPHHASVPVALFPPPPFSPPPSSDRSPGGLAPVSAATVTDLVPDDLPKSLSGSYLAGRSADSAHDVGAAISYFDSALEADPD